MIFKKIPQIQYVNDYIETAKEKKIRLLILVTIISIVLYSFWQNSASQMERINHTSGQNSDATGTLGKEDLKNLKIFTQIFQKKYGIKLDVRITNELIPPVLPKEIDQANTIFIGLCPSEEQFVMWLPPLVRKILPLKFADHVEQNIMLPKLQTGEWPDALNTLLNELVKEFDKAL